MRITIDTDERILTETGPEGTRAHPLDSPEAFRLITDQWLAVGWTQKYSYGFSWFGRPIIQLPEDLVRIQEVIYEVKPDVIVETGVAHGGSLVFYATLCKAMERGRIIGVDVEIRPHNRKAIEAHPLKSYITLIEGSSTDASTVAKVRALIQPQERVLVLLDSNHSKDHVLRELEAYSSLVSVGSYIVAADGIMALVAGRPGAKADWTWNNHIEAVKEYVAKDARFQLQEPMFPFNEGKITDRVTYWPTGYLKRVA